MRNMPSLKKSLYAIMFLFIGYSGFSQTIINIPITSSSDDAEEDSSGNMNLTSSDLELYNDNNDQEIGLRFQNVGIPSGSTITNAYIQFTVDETNESGPVTIGIAGEDVDNSNTFTTATNNISSRSKTTAVVENWTPANWTPVGASGTNQRTPNLSNIIQEIIDRGGWNSGNAMSLILYKPSSVTSTSNNRTAENYNGSSTPPILHVEYTPPPGPEIDVTGNSNTILNGDTTTSLTNYTHFGNVNIGSSQARTFTIQNTGTLDLSVGATVTLANGTDFSITAQPGATTITPAGSTTFTITFSPTSSGTFTDTVTITNNDSDENPFTFAISGTSAIIPVGGTWSYLDDGSDQGTAWYGTGFNYTGWATGNAELGYGDGDEATVVSYGPDANNKYPTTYFRKSFNITAADIASLKNTLVLNAIRDDGMVVYINGVEVWRDGMPATFNYLTYANQTIGGADESTWITTSINNPFTVAGTYEIGVEIHQTSGTSSDLSFDFEMYATNQLLGANGTWSYLDDGSDQGTAWRTADVSPTGANWAIGNAELGFGDGDETTVVADNNQITTYFRKTIIANGADVTNSTLQISAVRDDGIVVYINGTEVLRNNMPVGTVSYNTLAFDDVTDGANNFEDFWNVFKVPNTLVAGTNEIAVEIHQYNASSDDISFNMAFETNNDVIIVPLVKPDKDNDGREDYVDADDDNDGIPDLVEGCNTTLPETLETDGDGETTILNNLPITTTPLNDGNSITYSVNNTSNFGNITAYNAGEHGYGLRLKGPSSNAQLTIDFNSPVKNLFFKLIDFDESENIKIDVYDEFGAIVDLGTEEGIYHLGSYIEYTGSNTINEIYSGSAPNSNNPENRADDIYGGAYFYFPNINVDKVTFTVNYTGGGTIRLVGVQYCSKDTDGDGIDDFYDSDSDNDGIPDLVEVGGTDTDGDGHVDNFIDVDGDGITALYDTNDNSYFIEETGTLTNLDFDGDGIRNNVDLDADNDGILDIIEAGGTDANGDGQIDGFTDTDNDGYHDAFDGAGSILITGADTNADGKPDSYANASDNPDNSGLPNFLDVDSDDDGITDHTEAQATLATYVAFSGVDTDGDGILDVNDNFVGFAGNGFTPVDSDSDGIPDYIDTDSDNNGEGDVLEGHDTNGDGTVNSSDWGTCLNSITSNLGTLTSVDSDGDGLDDGFDNDLSTYDPSNMGMQPTDHPNIDDIATAERDWREPDQEYNVIDFDGFNDYIDFADSHNLTSSFTIEAWVKQDPTSTGNGMIVAKRDCNKGTNLGYSVGLINHYPNVKWYDNSGNLVFNLTSSYPIDTNRWYSLSITYDMASTTAKIYIDGIEVASNNSVSAPPSATNESLLIGAKFDDTDLSQKLSNEFKGWIDEVRIWNVALTSTQLRTMMNQEIQQNGTAVQGKIIPIDIPGLNWTDLLGYYPMNSIVSGDLIDQSAHSVDGRIRNILTSQQQTAPLPYTTKANGSWNDVSGSTPWTYGDSVWDAPNSLGVDGSTIIDWNIVETNHNVTIDTYSGLGREREVLGLIVASNELQVNGNTASGTGNGLTVSQYLKIDGILDLEGESQLIQSNGSVLDVQSSGTLERDQQGTADYYTYNYWAAPVGISNTSSNNNSYTLPDVLKEGTNPASPGNIAWLTSGYNGTSSPVGIADYWIWKYANQPSDNYPSWQHVRSTNSLQPGEGYTMKGVTDTGGVITTEQNYVFNGKPHNGDITLTLSPANDYLIGNPYASAIDANEFIKDNISTSAHPEGRAATNIINGTLYYWDHFANSSHNLADYEGGYATYNLSGTAVAVSNDTRIHNSGALGTKVPGQYIPVGQGFFVIADAGGSITFKNSQRIFVKEGGTSQFMRSGGKAKKGNSSSSARHNNSIDTREKIKLMFDSPNGYHRQLLVTADQNATNNYDYGYDGILIDESTEDMYWTLNSNEKLVIQGVTNFNLDQVLPLVVKTNQEGTATIRIDELKNIPIDKDIYIHDKSLETYHNLRDGNYDVYLTSGEHSNRFEIVFTNNESLSNPSADISNLDIHYSNNIKSIIVINPNNKDINSIEMFNILGQEIYKNENISNKAYYEFKVNNLHSGTYLINLKTNKENVVKKVIVE